MILLIGTETETKAFMAICVETLKRFVWRQLDVFFYFIDVDELLLLLFLFVCLFRGLHHQEQNAAGCER